MIVRIKNIEYPAEYFNTQEQIEQGLKGRTELNGCALFRMSSGYHTFWMKDCLIPLDIVFVYNNKITKIFKNCQPCSDECPDRYTAMGDHVLEFNANETEVFNIGDFVRIIP